MSSLETDLSMASLSSVKVGNLDELVQEAHTALDNHLTDTDNYNTLTAALTTIQDLKSHEVTPEIVNVIDEKINAVASSMSLRNDKVEAIIVEGTESFGLTLSPTEWKATRIAACESMIEDLGRWIKDWSRSLGNALSNIFTGNKYKIESLEERMVELVNRLSFIKHINQQKGLVTIPEGICRTLRLSHNTTLATFVEPYRTADSEVTYLSMIVSAWGTESAQYKNRLIKYFGNKGKDPIFVLKRLPPKPFSKRLFIDEDNSHLVTYGPPKMVIGGGAVNFQTCERKDQTPEDFIRDAEHVGYYFGQSSKYDTQSGMKAINVSPLPISELENMKGVISKIIAIMKVINQKDNDFDFIDRDVKDITNTLKDYGDENLTSQFIKLASRFNYNTTYSQADLIEYLGTLASHLITFLFIHMEAYDGE